MASSQFALFLVVASALGISLTFGCGTELQICTGKVQDAAMNTGDVTAMCKVYSDAKACLETLQGQCEGDMGTDITEALKALKQSAAQCGDSDSGKATDCSATAYDNCDSHKTDKDHMCHSYKCVHELKMACDGKGFDDYYHKSQKSYDEAKKTCGCGALRPSIIALLAAALIMTLRPYF